MNTVTENIEAVLKELKPLEKVKVKSISHATERVGAPKSSRCYVMEFTNGKTVKFYIHGSDRAQLLSKNLKKAEYLGIDKSWLTGPGFPTTMAKVGIRVKIPHGDGKHLSMFGIVYHTEGRGRTGNDYIVE